MTEQNNKPGDGNDSTDLGGALRELGQQFEAVFRAAMESDRTKQLRRDLTNGVRTLTSTVESAVKTAQVDPRVQQAGERGREMLSQLQSSKVVQDVQEVLVSGIDQVNEQLNHVIERLQTETNSTKTTSQDVPIEHEPPTTGETTKLD